MMGTLPAAHDINSLDDLLDLKAKIEAPSANIDDITAETKRLIGTLFDGEDLSGEGMLEAMCEIERKFATKTVGDLEVLEEGLGEVVSGLSETLDSRGFYPRYESNEPFNSIKKPTTVPSYNPESFLSP